VAYFLKVTLRFALRDRGKAQGTPGPRFESHTADRATLIFFVLTYKEAILPVYDGVCCETPFKCGNIQIQVNCPAVLIFVMI
jgi:hypothetical protein